MMHDPVHGVPFRLPDRTEIPILPWFPPDPLESDVH